MVTRTPLLVPSGGVTLEKQKGSGPGWIVVLLIGCALGWLIARRKPKGEIYPTKTEPEPEGRNESGYDPLYDYRDPGPLDCHYEEEPERPTGESGTGPPTLVLVEGEDEDELEEDMLASFPPVASVPVHEQVAREVGLTNMEYITFKMQECPGESQRFYRGNLYRYHNGVFQSDNYGQYFRRGSSYRNSLWVDRATRDVVDKMPSSGLTTKPKRGELHLTQTGWEFANKARVKLGMEELPWSINLE